MSDSPSEKSSAPARPMNRWRIGTLSVLQVLVLVVILVSANYLSSQYYQRDDLSRGSDFTLSTRTLNFLHSPVVQNRQDPVVWLIAFRASSPFYDRVRVLAEQYARESKGKIVLKLVDPVRNPDEIQVQTKMYGVYDPGHNQLNKKDLVVIDARTKDQIRADAASGKPVANNVRILDADLMVTWEVANRDGRSQDPRKNGEGKTEPGSPSAGARYPVAFAGEDVLTAGLVAAIEGVPRKVYFIADKSRINAEGENSSWKTLVSTMALQNILLEPITLADKVEIPPDAAGIAIVAPKYDFTPDEISVLERYWQRPKSSILTMVRADEIPPRLRTFLRNNGISPRRDHVVANRQGHIVSQVAAAFTPGVPFTKDLAGQATLLEGASCSLDVREGQDELLNARQIHPMPLLQADNDFWGETKFGQGHETFDPREDNPPPIYLAAGVIRGAENSDKIAGDSSRMIVIGNTDFLEAENLRKENLDFFASSLNWLVGREELFGLGPRTIGTYKLPLLDAQASLINRINLVFLPAAVLLIAGFVWSSRRA